MTNPSKVEVRPRTLGELFDDAWRMYLDNAAVLLALTGLVYVPGVAMLLVMMTQSWPEPWLVLIPAGILAALLSLGGLTSGACQEIFHLWAEKQPATFGKSLNAARRRWLNHATAQMLLLILPLAGVLCLFSGPLAGLGIVLLLAASPFALMGICWQAVLTGGQKNVWKAFRYSRRCAGRHFGKAVVVIGARLFFLLAGMLNLHLFLTFAIHSADELAGLEIGFLGLVLTPANPTYLLLLAALVWWLLTPFNEAVNYLFYVDARTRFEGLDLWYQIEEFFPVRQVAKSAVILLALAGVLLLPAAAQSQTRLEVVKKARQDVVVIQKEMKSAKPYPGGRVWRHRLRPIAHRLDPDGDANLGRYRWFYKMTQTIGDADRDADLKMIAGAERRLQTIEKSLSTFVPRNKSKQSGLTADQIKKLIPALKRKEEYQKRRQDKKKKNEPEKKQQEPIQRDVDLGRGFGGAPGGGGLVPAASVGAGLGQVLIVLLIVVLAAVLVAGFGLFLQQYLRNRQRNKPKSQGNSRPAAEAFLENPDKENVQNLWRRADDLARSGKFLDALRTLYLAVLAMLHQAHLIRYERTRTNGEYADQLRKLVSLHPLFLRMTGIFEIKWYGERSCGEDDYQSCRDLADRLQQQTQKAGSESS